jgi:hypothetical protein
MFFTNFYTLLKGACKTDDPGKDAKKIFNY